MGGKRKMIDYISFAITFCLGGAVSLLNFYITNKSTQNKEGMQRVMMVSILRMIICVAYIAAVFAVCELLEIDAVFPLLGAGLGITVLAIVFALALSRKTKK